MAMGAFHHINDNNHIVSRMWQMLGLLTGYLLNHDVKAIYLSKYFDYSNYSSFANNSPMYAVCNHRALCPNNYQ